MNDQRNRRWIQFVWALLLGLGCVSQAGAVPPLPDEFVNDQVSMLAVFDMGQVNPGTIDATGRDFLKSIPEAGEYIDKLRADYTPFVSAGGRFIVFAESDSWENDYEVFVPAAGIYVDAKNCDEEALMNIIRPHAQEALGEPVIERHGEWIFVWKSSRNRLKNIKEDEEAPQPPATDPARAERLRTTFAALTGRAAGMVVVPGEDAREMAELEMDLPKDSPANVPMILARASAIHGWIDLGHNPSITAVAELPEATMATQLASIIQALPALAMAEIPDPEYMDDDEMPEISLMLKIVNSISCVPSGNRVTVTIGQAHLREIIDDATPILVKQAEDAKQYQVMANGRMISMELVMYMQENDEQWPASLDTLVEKGQLTREQLDELLTHPVTGEKNTYRYIRPSKSLSEMDNPGDIVILQELKNGAVNPEGCSVFADGHVELGQR